MTNILHILHRYRGDYPLLNSQVNLDRTRFRTVACYLSGPNDGKNGLDKEGCRVLYLNRSAKHLRWYNLPLILQLKRIMEEEDIQVVNCQQHRTVPLGVLAALAAGNRPAVVATLHGLGTARSWRRKLFNWLLFKRVFRVVGISGGVSEDIVRSNWKLPAAKVVTVQNGLVYDRFLEGPDKSEARGRIRPGLEAGFWFGTAGRLSPVKNHETLIRAFARVADEIPHALLLIAGQGDLEKRLKDLARSLGLGERVVFLGFRRDILVFLRALDVFLLPSLREGLPLALLEAMACGLPAVASRVGGIPEVFGDTDMGRLIDPEDPDSLAEGMLALAQASPERLQEMGRNARDRALRDFSAERMIRSYERLYQEAAAAVISPAGQSSSKASGRMTDR